MEVAEILRSAVEAVEKANVPDDLRIPAFESALLLFGGSSGSQPPQTIPVPQAGAAATLAQQTGSGDQVDERLQRVAAELGIAPDTVERVFDDHEGDLQYVGDLEALGKSKASKVQALAVLLVAARLAGGYDEGSTLDIDLRKEIDRHGLLDTGNYTKHISPLKNVLNFNGAGRNLNFKVKYEGRQRAKVLAGQALGK